MKAPEKPLPPFWRRHIWALSFFALTILLVGVVLWQRRQLDDSTARMLAANRDIIKLQNDIEQWKARHSTVEQALRDCQEELRTRTVPRLPGVDGRL